MSDAKTQKAPRQSSAFQDAVKVTRPARQTLPIVVASPHSGRDYPADFIAQSPLDALTLRSSEDAFVDRIVAAAPELGAPVIAALFPRVYIDVNREPYELDPSMFAEPLPPHAVTRNARISAGLGTIPKVVANQRRIHDRKLTLAEAETRLDGCYRPYHRALAELIEETRERFGLCILLDCHSMPSSAVAGSLETVGGGRRVAIVTGDCHGTSADRAVVEHVEHAFERAGHRVRRNAPYAGGYVTRHYGQPTRGVHAVQIEINRALYLNEGRVEPTDGLARLAVDFAALLATPLDPVLDAITPTRRRLAAE